jgi:hypothetical protein
MKSSGWQGRDLGKIRSASKLVAQLEDLDDSELRVAVAQKMVKVLKELQENVDRGLFSPQKNSGYTLKEVEGKVHELRREIRKVPMYAGYLEGVFGLSDKITHGAKQAERALALYAGLTDSPLAKSPFALLPKASITKPLLIPRPLFLAVTKYVSDLGLAKDWAQNIERLVETGLPGEISFDQLDPALKDVFGRPEPFNKMVLRTISEIQNSKIFFHMARNLEAQAQR